MTVSHPKRKLQSSSVSATLQYTCDSCLKDISALPRIKCEECEELDLCVECFATGVEMGKHLAGHPFRVVEPYSFAVYRNRAESESDKDLEWRADEDLLLLEGAELHGLGNWFDIAQHIGSKTEEQVKEHYFNVYLNSNNWPLPESGMLVEGKRDVPSDKLARPMAESPKPTYLISQPADHEISGYMPLRNDFDVEFENDGEERIKDMIFYEDDDPTEIQWKLTMLEIYSSVLDKRQERKEFIDKYGLFSFKRHMMTERAKGKNERDLFNNNLKVFARFMSPQEFDELYIGLVHEMDLANRIQQLQSYRMQGIISFSEIPGFETKHKLEIDRKVAGNSAMAFANSIFGQSKSSELLSSRGDISNQQQPVQSMSPIELSSSMPHKPIATRKVAAPLDISHLPNIDLLSGAEKELCSILRLTPNVYLSVKESLLKEQARTGHLKRATARSLIKIDVNKTSRVYDFFAAAGWIKVTADEK